MKRPYTLGRFCTALVLLSTLTCLTNAQVHDHSQAHHYEGPTAYYLAEHGDFGVGFEDGRLKLHIHLHAGTIVDGNALEEDTVFEPDQLIILVGEQGQVTRPQGELWAPVGIDANEPLWVLPQIEQEGLPALGLATEEIDSGIFLDDSIALNLRYIKGPGDFCLWETNAFGMPEFLISTHDALLSTPVPTGVHAHYNWGFTAPGAYTLVFEATGQCLNGQYAEALSVYTFTVADGPFCLTPPPGDLNGDCVTDMEDLLILVDDWEKTGFLWDSHSYDDGAAEHHHEG